MGNKINAIQAPDVSSVASKARILNALLQNIFIHGTENCAPDDELVGLAYNLSGNVALDLDRLEKMEAELWG